jgi:hypothetical protein
MAGKGRLAYLKVFILKLFNISSIENITQRRQILAAIQTKGLPSENKFLNIEIS